MNNHTNPGSGSNREQGKHTYPLDSYTTQPQQQGGKESPFYVSNAPAISLPKGGGALKGIDEKFNVNAINGTASLQIPLPLTPGRNNFTPSLTLSYNSGSGNSEFGLGWDLSLPSIQRKTDKQLPLYDDAVESDVFLLAGAEDLVPFLKTDGTIQEHTSGGYTIRRYRPRIEGLFSRIEYIRRTNSTDSWWRVTSKENITTWYGLTPDSRITDPAFAHRTFKWLPKLTIDNKGNVQEYTYVAENDDLVPDAPHEKNRLNDLAHYANKYLKKVSYCNTNPFFVADAVTYEPPVPTSPEYMMEAIFDFGDHATDIPAYDPDVQWPCRKDPFSTFQAGFEIRTWRKCRRVIIFHSFAELSNENKPVPVPIRSLDLSYHHDTTPDSLVEADLIQEITQTGYKKTPDGSSFYKKSLPPMVLNYQPLQWNTSIQTVDTKNSRNAPQGLTGTYQWTDLYGEGISGILSESADGWFYKSNLGNGQFTEALPIAQKPSLNGLGKELQWQDLEADGRRQLVSNNTTLPGYFELDDDQHWQGFIPFKHVMNINWRSPYTKMLDLNGDGRPDILITDEHIWTWWSNEGKEGYITGGKTHTHWDEEKGPRLLINDTIQSVFLADMNGDGLTDLVRIKNGEVCYWPNLGYGKFGAKVTMSNAPQFAPQDLFNPTYLHLADISGTGAPDLLYRTPSGITAWINLAGNGWGEAVPLGVLPSVEASSTIAVIDFLGNGTSCIVWSSPLPQQAASPMKYIDLMGGNKPHILRSYDNSMGKTVSLTYRSSTQYYLDDKKAGAPWATKLPFPVQCLSRVVTTDSVSATSYTQTYSYHHGYYDHEEREFRGFGRVETTDTDSAAFYTLQNGNTEENDLDQHPVHTKAWYHTGAWLRESTLLDQFAKEYFRFEGWDSLITYATMPTGLSPQEIREAYRTLKGAAIRQEVYALDSSPAEAVPYTVTVSAYEVRVVQEQKANRFASFLNHSQQHISWNCERTPVDARVIQELTLAVDEYGNVLESAQIAYPRKHTPSGLPELVRETQEKMYITYNKNTCTNDVITSAAFRLRIPYDSISCELHLPDTQYPSGLFTKDSFYNILPDLTGIIDYSEIPADSIPVLRRLSHSRSVFREDDAVTVAVEGTLHALAIPDQQYVLALTAPVVTQSFNDDPSQQRLNDDMIKKSGYIRYNDIEGFNDVTTYEPQHDWWWLPSGTATYSSAPATDFYTPVGFKDPWGNETTVQYWGNYFYLPQSTTDALNNINTVLSYDWRCLQPTLTKDANHNQAEISYDALCMPVAMAIKGKNALNITEADELLYNNGREIDADSQDDADLQTIFWDNPESVAAQLLGRATWRCIYDLGKKPAAVAMIAREEHYRSVADKQSNDSSYPDSSVLMRITYSDGMGRIAMHKVLAPDDPGTQTTRWTGSGKVVYNNKGNAVLEYESYFSETHDYDPAQQAAERGVSPRIHYDPLNRAFMTEMPDGTYHYTTWDSWTQIVFDANDTAVNTTWYADRISGGMGDGELDAAKKTEAHWATPATMYLDTLARPFYTVTMDGNGTEVHSYVQLDILNNRMAIIDGLNSPDIYRVQLQYRYNMLKTPVWQHSIDRGYQCILVDAAGQPGYSWDAENRRLCVVYDELRRPLRHEGSFYLGNGQWDQEMWLSVMAYGETATPSSGTIEDNNLRGQIIETLDGSGRHWVDHFDFKGQPVQGFTSLLADGSIRDADWHVLSFGDLSTEVFTTETIADALGRPVTTTDPGGNITRHEYNKAGDLRAIYLAQPGNAENAYINDIHYDAKGQRQAIWYGNNTKVKYTYDPATYRLRKLCTINLNANPHVILQHLVYCYDPVGNVTSITDLALDTCFYNNSLMKPESNYTYDALYRLIRATGREMINGNGFDGSDRYQDIDVMINATPQWDGTAMQNYTQEYSYDAVGNITRLRHIADTGDYTRNFKYDASNNYLYISEVGGNTYDYYRNGDGYDAHGNMLYMPHLKDMSWNFSNQLCKVDNGVGTWYQYSNGQRIRKYTDKGYVTEERIYLGNYEVYRKFGGGSLTSERSTVHIADDSGRVAMLEVRNPAYGSDGSEDVLLRYIYSNHLGSSSLELDASGAIISYEEYHPYGTTAFQAMNPDIKSTAKRYRFTGKERDDESGFYYHGARYYVPWLCRWTAVDPMEHKYAGLSPYNYCYNNPVMWNDLNGSDPVGDEPVRKKQIHQPIIKPSKIQNEKNKTSSIPDIPIIKKEDIAPSPPPKEKSPHVWDFTFRSFISVPKVGGDLFRGDGRGPSTDPYPIATSRTWLNFSFDTNTQSVLPGYTLKGDPTIFYGNKILPRIEKTPQPEIKWGGVSVSYDDYGFGWEFAALSFHYWAKDPVTPAIATPSLDLHVTMGIRDNVNFNTLYLDGEVTGDTFPSAEAFVTDQTGFKLLLGAKKEEGGVSDLFGDNKKHRFDFHLAIRYDENGKFTEVKGTSPEGDIIRLSPEEWNNYVKQTFGQ